MRFVLGVLLKANRCRAYKRKRYQSWVASNMEAFQNLDEIKRNGDERSSENVENRKFAWNAMMTKVIAFANHITG